MVHFHPLVIKFVRSISEFREDMRISRETEKIFKELHAFLEERGLMDMSKEEA